MIKIANAPCSWGALEFGLEGEVKGYQLVLDEMAGTGYEGTELGDWGFMPTDPEELRQVLQRKNLSLLGAFVPVALARAETHDEGTERAVKTAGLMYHAGFKEAFVVLADENGTIPGRVKNAGRITPEMGLTEAGWQTFAEGAEKVALAVREAFGMRTVFHHHCGGYVETPGETDQLMKRTNPELLGLCLDMGHYAFGGGDPVEALKRYEKRIWHVHFKDFDPEVGKRAAEQGWDYFKAVENGVFCELGKGSVDFQTIAFLLKERPYSGWIVVEQDIIPGMGTPKESAARNRDFIKRLGF
ncbi:MAG: sugar phosphate isomerase/epimerase [Mangrovibacterium sp.]|nr:sugar phosphate isomerase/epimerase [Mangrovibacterium sp.]